MPTITEMLSARQRKNEYYPIVIYMYYSYEKRYIDTGFKIEKKYWKKNQVIKHSDAAIINGRIADIVNQVKQYFAECLLKVVGLTCN